MELLSDIFSKTPSQPCYSESPVYFSLNHSCSSNSIQSLQLWQNVLLGSSAIALQQYPHTLCWSRTNGKKLSRRVACSRIARGISSSNNAPKSTSCLMTEGWSIAVVILVMREIKTNCDIVKKKKSNGQ